MLLPPSLSNTADEHFRASVCTADIDPMRYTAYTEECCRLLEAAGGSTDLYLVRLVRLHGMVERIDRMISFDEYAAYGESSTPISTRIKTFEAELQEMKQTQPPHNLHDCALPFEHRLVGNILANASSNPSIASFYPRNQAIRYSYRKRLCPT
jgi:hypothetical protein